MEFMAIFHWTSTDLPSLASTFQLNYSLTKLKLIKLKLNYSLSALIQIIKSTKSSLPSPVAILICLFFRNYLVQIPFS